MQYSPNRVILRNSNAFNYLSIRNNDMFESIISSLNERNQEKLLLKEGTNINFIFPYCTLELQDKYFTKFINTYPSIVLLLDKSIIKAHIEEILPKFSNDTYVINKIWEFIPSDKKYESFVSLMDNDAEGYQLQTKWKELSEIEQRTLIGRITDMIRDGKIRSVNTIWESTSPELKKEHLSEYLELALKNNDRRDLEYFWEKTEDYIQMTIRNLNTYYNLSNEQRKAIYNSSNSKLQSQMLAEDIRKNIRYFDYSTPLYNDLINAKDKVFEMNFKYIFKHLQNNDEYLFVFLNKCNASIKEANMELLKTHFKERLIDDKYNFSNTLKLVTSANCHFDMNDDIEIIDALMNNETQDYTNVYEFWNILDNNKIDIFKTICTNSKYEKIIDKLFRNINFENKEEVYEE